MILYRVSKKDFHIIYQTLMNSTEFGKENLIRRRNEVVQNGSMIFLLKLPKNTTVRLLFWHGKDSGDVDAILMPKEVTGNGGMCVTHLLAY